MIISLIAAVGKNLEIGKDNNLIWYLPDDLKFFKKVTTNHTVLMGRITFESIKKALPNRRNIVISSNKKLNYENIEVYDDIDIFINSCKDDEIFIIGGSSIYKSFIDKADKIYLTEIDKEDFSADSFFPNFNKELYNKEIISSHNYNDINYKHVLYTKKISIK